MQTYEVYRNIVTAWLPNKLGIRVFQIEYEYVGISSHDARIIIDINMSDHTTFYFRSVLRKVHVATPEHSHEKMALVSSTP